MAPMPSISELSHLLNPLATSQQLETSASQLDGVPRDLEDSIRFETSRLVQAAGILLRLPQEIIAQCIVILQRFWTGPDGGSLLEHDSKDVAAAALYLTAKPLAHPMSARQVLTSFEYLSSLQPGQLAAVDAKSKLAASWHLSEGRYEAQRQSLYEIETHILRVLGFQTHVALPHSLCINYLQTLDAFQSGAGKTVVKAAFAHLNSALLSPQLLYLTHQPSALATAAIYLAARETNVKLPEVEWWEVFDVDREELGFLVVAFRSLDGFATAEKQIWARRGVPLSVEDLRAEIERAQVLEAGS
ncbi:Putative Cyclin-like superfamily, cyclin/Cyclin-like subunit Ssn8 [Septoria linicola]|uniref:Cyclin-like superfamily, cyclin/Cyclin-like subunit Ssn8 n=1 Tax=Septoria linicola TaxID=215465 RepID=A0A9Q9ATV8_9PEZI|nr:putative Cyclin-like superfamily, cyclin/Cyclin-like subunit Ssn8 [Septoria linicola]USW55324.1 Putative Cyclin-like superfamily, cyclin/Cyclin-like subunit Ssn8 [Septoria linicola]